MGLSNERVELNDEHDCCVTTHQVRDVAGQTCRVWSFSAAMRLRYMQGDFQ
jgi:hypothetical protein